MFSLKPRFLKGLYLRLKDLVSYIWNKIIVFIRWYRRTYKRVRWYKKALMLFVTLFCVFFLYLGMVDVNFLWLFGKSPSLETISHPKQDIASVIYSSDGVVLGRYYRENRIPITYEEIPKSLVDALISTEDERFYEHFGIDVHGIFAAVKDMVAHGEARGASTIIICIEERVNTIFVANFTKQPHPLNFHIMTVYHFSVPHRSTCHNDIWQVSVNA